MISSSSSLSPDPHPQHLSRLVKSCVGCHWNQNLTNLKKKIGKIVLKMTSVTSMAASLPLSLYALQARIIDSVPPVVTHLCCDMLHCATLWNCDMLHCEIASLWNCDIHLLIFMIFCKSNVYQLWIRWTGLLVHLLSNTCKRNTRMNLKSHWRDHKQSSLPSNISYLLFFFHTTLG